ncbi:hypothetical protein Acsp03_71840 [Actinomadura sp. NBRC 104412]|uniref:hypothetical protein n=1 Tax=Actinomadura sp. NBRC 104412 TaxID=3032203 RepID=UPI0024A5CCE2|nr:hypothetical protein [Actinomadura sp. NBRC 104412]GLZ09718.1 hypothetical protein Acsp03_71840 [Actinomadura sp. NBRC 104412]
MGGAPSTPVSDQSWLDEAVAALRKPDKAWCDEDRVSFVVAARELTAWLHDRRPYEGRHRPGWRSALRDFFQAAGDLGPEVTRSLGGELPRCRSIAQDLQSKITALSPVSFKALLATQSNAYRTAFQGLIGRFSDADVRLAAWNDVLAGYRTSVVSHQELAKRRDLFLAVIRAANLSPDRIASNLRGVLSNNAFEIFATRRALGDADAARSDAYPRPNQSANLGESERLSLCERLLTQSPQRAHYVVWVVFQHASMTRMVQTVGPITFYDAELIKSLLQAKEDVLERLPEELRDKESFFQPSQLPEERDTVLARVDLGMSSFADPVLAAREQAEAVVALAGFRFGRPRWRILQGYLLAVDGRIRGMGAFMPLRDPDSLPVSASSDPMSDLLQMVEADLAPHLPVDNPELIELIEALHTWQKTDREEPLSSIILHMRIVELVAARVTHGAWYEFLDDYLCSTWVRDKILDMLHSAVFDAAYGHIEGLSSAQEQERRDIQLALFKSTGYGHEIDLAKAYEALPRLVSMHPPQSQSGRELRHVMNLLSSPASIVTLRDDLLDRWDIARERLQRIRNALAHGGPVDVDGAKTVHGFARQLAAWSLSRSLAGILKRNGVVDEHTRRRDEANSWFAAVPNAADAKSAIFPN